MSEWENTTGPVIETLHQQGPHRVVKFPRGDGGYWYRSETVMGQGRLLSGSTYGTYEEAYQDFLYTTDQKEEDAPRLESEVSA